MGVCEVTENLATPKAADLPVGSIVATDTLVGLKAEPSGPFVSGWRMTNGGRYHDKHIDELLADGAAILR